jgi:hypothetical protein
MQKHKSCANAETMRDQKHKTPRKKRNAARRETQKLRENRSAAPVKNADTSTPASRNQVSATEYSQHEPDTAARCRPTTKLTRRLPRHNLSICIKISRGKRSGAAPCWAAVE